MIIVGAGLAGLIAAHVWPRASVLEAAPEPQPHRALLRFRGDVIGVLAGVPFRRVRVYKGLYDDEAGALVPVSVRTANQYARKVTPAAGMLGGRSVWSLDAVDRYVAPEDLHERMLNNVRGRVSFNTPAERSLARGGEPLISTAPIEWAVREFLGRGLAEEKAFRMAPVFVERWSLPNVDLHQTLYFPWPGRALYRASITGNTLIAESVQDEPVDVAWLLQRFGLGGIEAAPTGSTKQSRGKIAPIEEQLRRELIHQLSVRCRVYSVGRFATWRNILLDDVVQDCRVVNALLQQDEEYALRIMRAN